MFATETQMSAMATGIMSTYQKFHKYVATPPVAPVPGMTPEDSTPSAQNGNGAISATLRGAPRRPFSTSALNTEKNGLVRASIMPPPSPGTRP
ncbi:MAG: hypothetical protein ACLTJ9_12610 [Eggerthella lenta]